MKVYLQDYYIDGARMNATAIFRTSKAAAQSMIKLISAITDEGFEVEINANEDSSYLDNGTMLQTISYISTDGHRKTFKLTMQRTED